MEVFFRFDEESRIEMPFQILFAYFLIVNIIGFSQMGIDKKRAVRGAWRISEASLFLTALLGGALGSTLGMHYFRHKTRHWYFRYGMPAIFAAELFLFSFILVRLA